MKRSVYSPISASMRCSSRAVPSVATTIACVSPRVNNVSDYLKEGQIVKVKVLEADDKGRVRLSRKALLEPPARREESPPPAPAESTAP